MEFAVGDIVKKSGLKQFSPVREGMAIGFVDFIKRILGHIMPTGRLSLGEAAAILNVPESYLDTLLEEKAIPHVRRGTRKQIWYGDLMEYKRNRDRKRSQGLAQLAAMTQECDSR